MTGVFIVAWIVFTLLVFYILYKRVCHITSSFEQFQDVYDPTDLQAFFKPYQLEEVCTIFSYVYPKVVQSETLGENNQKKSDEQAREAANALLKKFIPGTLLSCPIKLPTEKTLDAADEFLSALPDTFLATVYASLVYSTKNLQLSLATMTRALQNAQNARKEGFTSVCSKAEAEEKRKLQATQKCTLPEELTAEQKQQLEATKRERIQAKMRAMVAQYLNWRKEALNVAEKAVKNAGDQFEKTKQEKDRLEKKVKDAGEDVPDELEKNFERVSEEFGTLEAAYFEAQVLRTSLQQSTESLVKTCQSLMPKLDKIKTNLEQGNYDTSILEGFFQSPLR